MREYVGHEKQREELVRLIMSGRSHAFLLSGPEQVGKRTIACALAARLARGEALDTLPLAADAEIQNLPHVTQLAPEIHEEKAKTRIKKISVDAVRHVSRQMSFRAATDTYNILIIDDAHEMVAAAHNALLKLIEEPPERTLIFVVSADAGRLPQTIISRVSRVQFSLLADDMLALISDDPALLALAFGRPGALVDFGVDEEARAQAAASLALLTEMRTLSAHERLVHAERLSADVPQAIATLALWVRRIHSVAHESGAYPALSIAAKVEDTIQTLKTTNANRRLVLEELFVRL